jgi:uncharacterized protein YbbC (DUF1343 family)
LPDAAPADVGLDARELAAIDADVAGAIARGEVPGAVVLVVRDGKVALRKAYGLRSEQPREPMTADTVFDLASLSKPIATAAAVMLLVERGRIHLGAPAARYWPEFAQAGKESVTIEQLLLHASGLPADNGLAEYAGSREETLARIARLAPIAAPGSKVLYSDVGYIVLGEIVARVSGAPLDAFTREHLFTPLGMAETGFLPDNALSARIAPTERHAGRFLRGEVHDPRARRLGGVAGHAGLFGTADDLAVFAEMLLEGGEVLGRRVFLPGTVNAMVEPRPIPGAIGPPGANSSPSNAAGANSPAGGARTLGWSARPAEPGARASIGHTGFTGTGVRIDLERRMAVVVLTSRLHPDGQGNADRLRGEVLARAAAASKASPSPRVLTGIDVLRRDGFRALQGRRVGLCTNASGAARDGTPTIDLLARADGVTLVALFSPEHGIRGDAEGNVADGVDTRTGLPIRSLYGARRRPTPRDLAGIDTLVFDVQDAGARFYTYTTTLGYLLEAAAAQKVKVVVLDRPNPAGGDVEGPLLDKGRESFTGYHPLPVRHGMTVGELARLFNAERGIGADLTVIPVEGWRRGDRWDRTGLAWRSPSPNLRSPTAALLYPGIGPLETTNVSVGRGTDRPFEVVGAPFIDGAKLAAALTTAIAGNAGELGVSFSPTRFTPTSSTHAGVECGGVRITLDPAARADLEPFFLGLTIAATLRRLYPTAWRVEGYATLLANKAAFDALSRGDPPARIRALWEADLKGFLVRRQGYLFYAP